CVLGEAGDPAAARAHGEGARRARVLRRGDRRGAAGRHVAGDRALRPRGPRTGRPWGDRAHPNGLRPGDPGRPGHRRSPRPRLESGRGVPTECGPSHSGPTRAMTTEQTPDHAAEAPAEDLPLEDVIETLRAELDQVRAQNLVDRA